MAWRTWRTRGAVAAILAMIGAACAASGDAGDGGSASTGDAGGGSSDSASANDDGPNEPSDGPPFGKSCAGLADGTPCGPAPDVCHDAALCQGGACAAAASKANGVVCAPAPDLCHTDGTCTAGKCSGAGAQPDGFNWQAGDDTARCCGAKEVHTTSDTNCGVCGIQCNASNGESCQVLAGQWFCRGCVASDACWSKCCSTSFTPFSCAASDCSGNCVPSLCPSGSHCVSGGTTSSDYCSY